jgi:hypothetical protein
VRRVGARGVAWLGLVLAAAACEGEGGGATPGQEGAGATPGQGVAIDAIGLDARWECCRADAPPGFTLRIEIGLPSISEFVRFGAGDAPERCRRLPPDARLAVNGAPVPLLDPGGPVFGGPAGDAFVGCEPSAIAEIGPMPIVPEEVRVTLALPGASGTTHEALFRGVVTTSTDPSVLPEGPRLPLGKLVRIRLPASTAPSDRPMAELESTGAPGEPPIRRGAGVLFGADGVRFRVRGRPGPAKLVVRSRKDVVAPGEGCVGFRRCVVTRAQTLGPFDVELVP